MILLGLDTETTGFSPKDDRVVEIGLVHWDVELHRAVRQYDFLVKPEIELPAEKWAEVAPIHGITREIVEAYGVGDAEAACAAHSWYEDVDAVVAHNGTLFDKLVMAAWFERNGLSVPPVVWVDTRLDVPEPLTGNLTCIAAKKGFLNPFPHQALSDVLTMLRILDGFDIPKVIERARIPNIFVQSNVSFENKEQAKERGYYWRPAPWKQWLKCIKECDYDKEAIEAPFKIRVVPAPE